MSKLSAKPTIILLNVAQHNRAKSIGSTWNQSTIKRYNMAPVQKK